MDDAISRAAVHIVINSQIFDTEYPSELDELERQIDALPALDVVPVVRCKDCHFWTPSGVFGQYIIGGVYEYGRCPYFSETRECFYCGYGQKRTSNDEVTK